MVSSDTPGAESSLSTAEMWEEESEPQPVSSMCGGEIDSYFNTGELKKQLLVGRVRDQI